MSFLETNNVMKFFDDFCALDHTSLHIEKGTVYGLVGPNGAGKSTIIKHLTGVYQPDEGSVTLDGEPVYENPAVKSRIMYIPDHLYYFQQASTRDMMKFYQGIYPGFSVERYEKLKEFFPIDEKQNIRKLSKGMQKQVAFWLAICTNPDVLILDEPIDGLDPVMRKQVWNLLLSDVAERGTTVLISSHNLRELEDVCDHVGIMHKGKVLIEHSLLELQGNISKLQVAFENGLPEFPEEMPILHISNMGRIYTIIMQCNSATAKQLMSVYHPMLIDLLPLSLEEIFIYELGGNDYAVKELFLD